MNSKVTYHQQVSYCGKPRCRKCREGTGHGPYWYAYQTVEGRTTRTYVGKHLPPDVQATMEGAEPASAQASERELSTIRIYVLGQFRLERRDPHDATEWQTVTDASWQHQRVRALLGCLVSVEGRKLVREQIMDALWPDLETEAAGNRLDRAVYSLRQLFEPGRGRPATSPLLLTEREMVVLSGHPQVWIDADAFEHLLARAHASTDPGEKERLFEEAATLYGGDFLPEDRKNEWTRNRRESLLRSWIGLLLDLANLRIERDALNSAIEPLDRLLSIDATNEAAVQRLIKVLMQLGRRGEALRSYKKLSAVLQQEYRIAPLPETRALYDSLRAGGDKTTPAARGENDRGKGKDGAGRDQPPAAPLAGANETAVVNIGRAHQGPLVGREREFDMLRTLVTTTEHAAKFRLPAQRRSVVASSLDPLRRPQCILLLGDVGIGKTRLAEEVSRAAKGRGWAVAWSRVYAQEGSIPYRLWTEVLRKAMAQGAWQRHEVSKRPVVFQPLTALLPELQSLLPQVSFTSSPPEQEQLRLWEAARELLTLISEGTPLLIALDDLQWSDSSSCELLAYLARRIYGLPIIIIGTCRDNELGANHPLRPLLTDLQRENAVESVSLDPLNDEQIVSLISHIPHVPEPLVEHIRERAAGNPFFAEELARSVDERDGRSAALDLSLLAGGNGGEGPLPDTITAVLDLRMGRLSPDCQRLLGKAAVLGGSFSFDLINAMEASAPNADEDLVLELLEEGLHSGMLTEEGTGTRITYHFWHPLLVSHLYEKLSAARRALLHRRAAEILPRVHKNREEEEAAIITDHLLKGGASADQVAHYAEMAGDHAYGLFDHPNAEKHYRVALEHLDSRGGDWERQAYILERLGECTRIQGKFEEACRFYKQTLEVRKQHLVPLSIGYQQEVQIQALLWCEIGLTWYNRGDVVQAQQCYQHSEQVLQEARIVSGRAWAYLRYQQSYVGLRVGNYDIARRTAYEALKLFEEALEQQDYDLRNSSHSTRVRNTLAGDPINLGRTHVLLAALAASDGQCGTALTHLNTALALYEQHNRQREISIVCCNLGDVHLRKAELNLAQSYFRRSLNIAEQIGDAPSVCVALGNLGILVTRFGNLDEAKDWLKQCITLAKRTHDPVYESIFSSYLSTVLQEQGKQSDARTSLSHSLSVARSAHIDPCIGRALITLGNMYITQAIAIDASTSYGSNDQLYDDIGRKNNLNRAKKVLQRALALEGIEAETRIEGQIALSYAKLLLHDVEHALQLSTQAFEDAGKFELIWLVALSQRVLGSILVALDQQEQADQYFEQAIRIFHRNDMRLEYARTLLQFGDALMQRDKNGEKGYQQGLGYLREARQAFVECKAELDLQMVDHVLARYEQISKV